MPFCIKIFPVFLPPKPHHKYSYTNSHIFAVTAITQGDHRGIYHEHSKQNSPVTLQGGGKVKFALMDFLLG